MQEKATKNRFESIIERVITIIFTIGLFLSAFLFAMDIVNAQDLNYDSWADFVYNDTYNRMNNETKQNMDNLNYRDLIDYLGEKFPYFLRYSNKNADGVYYIFSTLEEFAVQTMWGSFTNNLVHIRANYSSSSVSTNGFNFSYNNEYPDPVLISFNGFNWNCIMVSIYITDSGYMQFNNFDFYYPTTPNTNMNYYENNDLIGTVSRNTTTLNGYGKYLYAFYSNVSDSSEHTFDTFDSNCKCYVTQDYNRGVYNHLDNTLRLKKTSTKGFNVFIYNDLGIDYVRFVPNGLVTVGSHYSNNPTISFDLVLNNEVTIPVTYDESLGYYFESIEYGKAYYEIPVIELLPSSIADFDNIYITNVVYTNEWSNPSESGTSTFFYVDKCWLKRTYNNEDIGQVSVPYESTDTGYSQQEITDIYNMITNASSLVGSFDVEKNLSGGSSSPISFSSFKDAVIREIECYHPTGTKSSDWISVNIDNITYDSGDNMYWLEYNSNSSQSFEHRYNYSVSPYSYVRENNYAGYYDIIYFIVHEQVYDSSGSGFSTLDNTYTRYYYFISNRYFSKLMLYREMDILEYLRLGNEGQEKIYDYLFYKINNIDDNAYHFFKDKLNIDNDIVDKIKEIDNSITLSTDSIMDLLNRILDALLDINIEPVEPLDITPITTRLDLILEKQTNSNLNNDWYKNFRQWLYEETDNSLVDTPHEWFIDKLNSIKSLYNIFGGRDTTFYYTPMMNVIDGYIHGQDLLNDETTYSTFYYKGTWSSAFNTSNFDSYHINNNNEVQ